MTIGINGNEANVAHRVGSGQYCFELLSHLASQKNSGHKFEIYLSSLPMPDLPKETQTWKYKVFGPTKLWTLTGLQNKLITEKMLGKVPDIFFSPTHYAPLYVPTKSVISIMDLSFETLPEFFKNRDLYQLRYWTRISATRAKKIITISKFSKDEICKIYKIPPEKVQVTHLGYDSRRFNPQIQNKKSQINEILQKYKINAPYFIFLGTLQPKKNLTRLIEAFASLPRKDISLVIVGMKNEGRGGWMFEQFFQKVNDLGLANRVIFTGYVPDDDVPYLFSGSLAYVLPSLYEGFGIAAIEAMATNVPVVISTSGSLPEICGPDVPFYIDDPKNVTCIQKSLQDILDVDTSKRTKKLNLGLEWVKRYNWGETAKQTLKLLESL